MYDIISHNMSAEASSVAYKKVEGEVGFHPEVKGTNLATETSNSFLVEKVGRGIGHAFRTAFGEGLAVPGALALPTFIYHTKNLTAPIASVASSLAAAAPHIPYLAEASKFVIDSASVHQYITSAVGYLSWMIGNEIGWQGAKNAGSLERNLYTGIKIAAPILASVGAFTQAPWAIPLAVGLSIGSTALAMRHRH